MKVMLPVGTAARGAFGLLAAFAFTCAVNATACPKSDGLGEEASVVFVEPGGRAFTVCCTGGVVLLANALLVAPRKVPQQFADDVNLQYAIMFSGKEARDEPSADLLAALSHATILRTDEHGTIEFILDGQTLVVRTSR